MNSDKMIMQYWLGVLGVKRAVFLRDKGVPGCVAVLDGGSPIRHLDFKKINGNVNLNMSPSLIFFHATSRI